jgi:hypothetical protein
MNDSSLMIAAVHPLFCPLWAVLAPFFGLVLGVFLAKKK